MTVVCHGVCGIGRCIEVVFAANVRKWEGMVRDDERELEKLKKEEQKMMKVTVETVSEPHSCVEIVILIALRKIRLSDVCTGTLDKMSAISDRHPVQ